MTLIEPLPDNQTARRVAEYVRLTPISFSRQRERHSTPASPFSHLRHVAAAARQMSRSKQWGSALTRLRKHGWKRIQKPMSSAVKHMDDLCSSTLQKPEPNRYRLLSLRLLAMIERKRGRIRLIAHLFDTGLAWLRMSCWGLAVLGIVAGLQLTIRSSSNMETVSWMPGEIAHWCEHHGRLRNLPAFFLLGMPFLIALRRPNQRLIAIAALSLFGAVLELAQLAIPRRWFDWHDITLTWCGLWSAWLLSEIVRGSLKRIRAFARVRRQQGYPYIDRHEFGR